MSITDRQGDGSSPHRELISLVIDWLKRIDQTSLESCHETWPFDGKWLHQISVKIPCCVDPYSLFSSFQDDWRVFWQGKDGDMPRVGLGELWQAPLEQARSLAFALPIGDQCPRIYGGISFDHQGSVEGEGVHGQENWQEMSQPYFFLPQFEYQWFASDHVLCQLRMITNQVKLSSDQLRSACQKLWQGLQERIKPYPRYELDHISYQGIRETPDFERWNRNINTIKEELNRATLTKVVLSRFKTVWRDQGFPVDWLLRKLAHNQEPSYLFAFGSPRGLLFLGRSPERVLAWSGHQVKVDAIAGTRCRRSDNHHDGYEASDLLSSSKDIAEHQSVTTFVAEVLGTTCTNIERKSDQSILKLRYVQHMISTFSGDLTDAYQGRDLLNRLHPTPAVAGVPRDKALTFIAKNEGFSRGWFAGSVGWLDNHAGDFAIAIRSAQIFGNMMRVFAGAGIVFGSDASWEWDETEAKMANFIDLLAKNPEPEASRIDSSKSDHLLTSKCATYFWTDPKWRMEDSNHHGS